MGANADRTRRGDGQHGDVAAAYAAHLLVKFLVQGTQALDEWVVFLALGIVHGELATLFGQVDRRTVGIVSQQLLYLCREGDGLVGGVTFAQGGQHVALGGDANARAAPLQAFLADVLPKVHFGAFHFVVLGVGGYLGQNGIDFLDFEVDDVVHHALRNGYMLREKLMVEAGFGRKRMVNVAVKVDGDESAAVVGA